MMVLYELTHIFFRYLNNLICSPKKLGLYRSLESIKQAIQYYRSQPGFCENTDAFSVKEKTVSGEIVNGVVFEALVYIHSEDYEFEFEVELGLCGDERIAQKQLVKYCRYNHALVNSQNFIVEKIVNKYTIGQKEWTEGFVIYD